ncbi:efflux RND transporter periplasmic adaptor subunit [Rhodovulum adriaticum]|uniref:CusB/HlyD membrane fusion family barrel-sandwich protein n=1 Tax=Rhodovulum adriaticum TaxID=35804 RepID=A0A4R2NTS5_RHOAD|nr:efflux RND transporter periplasmic adaptor subunit [Rhodovulum adriaticum]MBK1637149.1 hypothetical protein [Rhodovulum adriaticum]TCP25360.1 CusB/HlyD membrane fusion family barrel-sandwich protein [Rhodovulum adriaticum]
MTALNHAWPDSGDIPGLGLGPGVSVSRRGDADGSVFVKNAGTGRVLRLGAEEDFLLTGGIEGGSLQALCDSFAERFGKKAAPQTVINFLDQMVERGILVPVEDAQVVESSPSRPASTGPSGPKLVAGEVVNGDAPPEDEDPFGPELDEMEQEIFGEGRRPQKPGRQTPKPAEDASNPDAAATSQPPKTARFRPKRTPRPASDRAPAGTGTGDAAQNRGTPDRDARAESAAGARDPGPTSAPRAKPAPKPKDTQSQEGGVQPALARKKISFRDKLDAPGEKPGGMLSLFDPTGLLRFLSGTFGWLRYFQWLIYPLVIFAIMITLNRLSQYGLSFAFSFGQVTLIATLFVSMITVNLFAVLVPAVVAYRHGAEIRHFGFIFALFVIPRFSMDTTGTMLLDRAGKLAFHAAALKTRLTIFALTTFLWAVTRQEGTFLSDLAFIVSQIALLSFLITAFPLLPGNGYTWIATYVEQPFLRQRAFNYLFGTSKKIVERLPPPTPREKMAFALYALGSVLTIGVLASLFALHFTSALEGRFGGTGLLMFLGLLVALVLWMSVMKRAYRKAGAQTIRRAVVKGMRDGNTNLPVPLGGKAKTGTTLPVPAGRGGALVKQGQRLPGPPRRVPLAGVYTTPAKTRWRWVRRGVLVLGLAALIYGAFQPYTYETGGDFVILPDQRSKVSPRVEGELVEIYVDEGDIVEAGQPLARLSDLAPRHAVASIAAELEKARAVLSRLEAGASSEEIQVAREQVELAKADLPYKEGQMARAEALFERGTISQAELDSYRTAYAVALQKLRTAEANLAEVQAPASDADIRIARADVNRLEAELAYQQNRLDEVVIRAPVTGQIVTENVRLLHGKHMSEGELFVEIEDHRVARAEVRVPEADIGLVTAGDAVRLKAWASASSELVGEVVGIAPQAEEAEFGNTVRVKTQLDNSSGFFRPGMTGYAKIDGAEMKSWQAFSRLVDRFFRIEVWGWIP